MWLVIFHTHYEDREPSHFLFSTEEKAKAFIAETWNNKSYVFELKQLIVDPK